MKKVLCKKNFLSDGDILYKAGKYYNVTQESHLVDISFPIIAEIDSFYFCFWLKKNKNTIDWYFCDYFYSKQEERLLKLQRIDESS